MGNVIRDEWHRELELQKAEAKRAGKPWPPEGDKNGLPTLITWTVAIFWGLLAASVAAICLHQLYLWITSDWPIASFNVKTFLGSFITSASIIMLAFGFFWVKQRHGFIYGSIELGAAAITTFDICRGLADKHLDGPHWLLALLGSLYIAVRGLNNINEARPFLPKKYK